MTSITGKVDDVGKLLSDVNVELLMLKGMLEDYKIAVKEIADESDKKLNYVIKQQRFIVRLINEIETVTVLADKELLTSQNHTLPLKSLVHEWRSELLPEIQKVFGVPYHAD